MYKLRNKISSLLIVIFITSIFVPNVALGLESNVSTVSEDSSSIENISGFKLQQEFKFKGHPVYYYLHEKSGAQLVFEKNNNVDKKFEIAFRTPAENNRGANHVIEHCVLHGSQEYPDGNAFMKLRKLSYSSFLNAYTCPDCTCYPVASMDEDELNSLARVYTSCVFDPKFLTDRSVFEQEGIRYSTNNEGKPEVNGTVFNEIREYNVVDIRKFMFPDTQDKNVYGGDPLNIMDLTFEEICETYHKYYHPANCVIIMSGDMDFKRTLKWLSEDYLDKFDKIDFKGVEYVSQYPLVENSYHAIDYYKTETEKNIKEGTVFYVLNNCNMKDIRNKLSTMCSILNEDSSERTKFIKDMGYTDVSCCFWEDDFYDPVFMISFYSEYSRLVTKDALNECINTLFLKYPISQSEIDKYTKNDDFNLKVLNDTKIYDDNILSSDLVMSFVRFGSPISDKYFIITENNSIYHYDAGVTEKDMRDLNGIFIDGKKTYLVYNPVSDEKLSNEYRINMKLKDIFEKDKSKFLKISCADSEEKLSNNDVEDKNFKKMFKKLSDINVPKIACPLTRDTVDGKDCIFAYQSVGKYIKYKVNFKVNHLTKEQINYLNLLTNVFLSHGGTSHHTRKELEELISGKISMHHDFEACEDSENKKNVFITFDVLTDIDNLQNSFDFLKERVFDLKYDDKKVLKDQIYSLLSEIKSMSKSILEYKIYNSMQSFNSYSYMLSMVPMNEQIEFLEEVYKNVDSDDFIKEISLKMNKLVDDLFNRGSLYAFGVCCSEENSSEVKGSIDKFVKTLKDVDVDNNKDIPFTFNTHNRAIFLDRSLSNNYIDSMIPLGKDGKNIEWNPLCKIVTEYFLSPKIREENGAYGAAMYVQGNNLILSSWQDPNLKKTLDIFSNVPKFLREFSISQEELSNICKNLIGSYFHDNKLKLADFQLDSNTLYKGDYCKEINDRVEEIKNTSVEKLRSCIPLIEKAIKNQKITVLSGHLDDADREMFDLICEN